MASTGWRDRSERPVAVGTTVAILAVVAATILFEVTSEPFPATFALDFGHYLDATRRWLETGTPYLPRRWRHHSSISL